jgi:hypothetical protein
MKRNRPGPFLMQAYAGERDVRLGKRLVQLYRPRSRRLRFGQRYIRWHESKQAHQAVSVGQPGPSRCVIRVLLHGMSEVFDALLQTLLGPIVPLVTPSEVSVVRLGVDGAGVGQSSLLLERQPDPDFVRDGSRDFVFQGEHISQVAVNSTTALGQIARRSSSRVTTSPGRSRSSASTRNGCCCSLIFVPSLRSSPARRSTSNAPNRTAVLVDCCETSMPCPRATQV